MKYLNVSKYKLDRELFCPVKNEEMWIKPFGGLWASEYDEENNTSDWIEFVQDNMPSRLNNIIFNIFTIKDNAKIATINSALDLINLFEQYEVKPTAELIEKFDQSYFDRHRYLDFEKMSKNFDCIILTRNGLNDTGYICIFEHDRTIKNDYLYGWDVPCILIFNYDIININNYKQN